MVYNNDFYDLSIGDLVSFADDTVIFYKRNTWNKWSKIEKDFGNCISFHNDKLLTIDRGKIRFTMFSSFAHKVPKFA